MSRFSPLTGTLQRSGWHITAEGIVSPQGIVYPYITGGENEPKLVPESDLIAVKQGLEAKVAEWETKYNSTVAEWQTKFETAVQLHGTTKQQLDQEIAAKKAVEEKYNGLANVEAELARLKQENAGYQSTLSIYATQAAEAKAQSLISKYKVPESLVRTADGKAYKTLEELKAIEVVAAALNSSRSNGSLPLDGGSTGGSTSNQSGIYKISEALGELKSGR